MTVNKVEGPRIVCTVKVGGELANQKGINRHGGGLTPRERDIVQLILEGHPTAAIADRLGCTLSQLAIAWCASNPNVSTVITGASRVEQVHENLAALYKRKGDLDKMVAHMKRATRLKMAPPPSLDPLTGRPRRRFPLPPWAWLLLFALLAYLFLHKP